MNNKEKNIFAVVLFFLFLFLVVYVSRIYSSSKFISEKDVKEIVFFQSASDEKDVRDFKIETQIDENKSLIYVVTYSDLKGVYSFSLDGKTGKILKYSKLKNGEPLPEIFDNSLESSY